MTAKAALDASIARQKSAGDCMSNVNKSTKIPYKGERNEKFNDPESVSDTGSPSKVNHF